MTNLIDIAERQDEEVAAPPFFKGAPRDVLAQIRSKGLRAPSAEEVARCVSYYGSLDNDKYFVPLLDGETMIDLIVNSRVISSTSVRFLNSGEAVVSDSAGERFVPERFVQNGQNSRNIGGNHPYVSAVFRGEGNNLMDYSETFRHPIHLAFPEGDQFQGNTYLVSLGTYWRKEGLLVGLTPLTNRKLVYSFGLEE